MKRFAGLLAAATLALGLSIGVGALPTNAVGACGWYVEQQSYASTGFYSTYTGGTDYLYGSIVTYNDGCGHKQYHALMWTAGHTPLSYHTKLRVWAGGPGVCSYMGEWQGNTTSVWSPVYGYSGACGRSADNDNSYGWGTYDANGTTWVYVNQN